MELTLVLPQVGAMRSFETETKLFRAHKKKKYINTNLEIGAEIFLKNCLIYVLYGQCDT